jgi:hypothetical protein
MDLKLKERFLELWPRYFGSAKLPIVFYVFKRWDTLDEADSPEVVIFFAPPDVISGLFTLANADA